MNVYTSKDSVKNILFTVPFLARLFMKKTYCHSPAVVCVIVQKLTFSSISVITEDIYLKLRLVVYYQKGNPYQ